MTPEKGRAHPANRQANICLERIKWKEGAKEPALWGRGPCRRGPAPRPAPSVGPAATLPAGATPLRVPVSVLSCLRQRSCAQFHVPGASAETDSREPSLNEPAGRTRVLSLLPLTGPSLPQPQFPRPRDTTVTAPARRCVLQVGPSPPGNQEVISGKQSWHD